MHKLSPAVLILMLLPGLLHAADAGLTYTPPAYPEAPSVGPLLAKLVIATAAVLFLCIGLTWLARRGMLGAAPPAAGRRLRLAETMPLGGGSVLYLLRAGDKQYVAGVNRSGLQVLMPLTEPFDQALANMSEELAE